MLSHQGVIINTKKVRCLNGIEQGQSAFEHEFLTMFAREVCKS